VQFRHRLALVSATAVAAVAALPAGQAAAIPPGPNPPPPNFFCGHSDVECVHYVENMFSCAGAACVVFDVLPPLPAASRD
jgi:hypothetical protein